jgi:hypothetical protein
MKPCEHPQVALIMRCHNRLTQANGRLLCDSEAPNDELDCSPAQLREACAACDMHYCDQCDTQCLVMRWRSALQAEEKK